LERYWGVQRRRFRSNYLEVWQFEQIARAQRVEKLLAGRARHQNLVAEWDEEDLTLESRLLALQIEEEAAASRKASGFTESRDKGQNSRIAEGHLYWSNGIGAETRERYLKEMEEVGLDVADSRRSTRNWACSRIEVLRVAPDTRFTAWKFRPLDFSVASQD
jgi:hypothetical protein